ncbi:hypothetical protein [Desulfocurvus sp. DL9XJH121]
MTGIDIALLLVQIALTLVLLRLKNPHPKGSRDYVTLLLCRVAMILAVWSLWSFRFGLGAFVPGAAGAVIALFAAALGRTKLGLVSLALCVVLPAVGILFQSPY